MNYALLYACGKPPEILGCPENTEQDRETIEQIIKHFKKLTSTKDMKKDCSKKNLYLNF